MADRSRPDTLPASTGRALVVVATAARSAETDRRSAGFLAQLYACERRYSAYRQARRAEPAQASMAYREIAGLSRAALDRCV